MMIASTLAPAALIALALAEFGSGSLAGQRRWAQAAVAATGNDSSSRWSIPPPANLMSPSALPEVETDDFVWLQFYRNTSTPSKKKRSRRSLVDGAYPGSQADTRRRRRSHPLRRMAQKADQGGSGSRLPANLTNNNDNLISPLPVGGAEAGNEGTQNMQQGPQPVPEQNPGSTGTVPNTALNTGLDNTQNSALVTATQGTSGNNTRIKRVSFSLRKCFCLGNSATNEDGVAAQGAGTPSGGPDTLANAAETSDDSTNTAAPVPASQGSATASASSSAASSAPNHNFCLTKGKGSFQIEGDPPVHIVADTSSNPRHNGVEPQMIVFPDFVHAFATAQERALHASNGSGPACRSSDLEALASALAGNNPGLKTSLSNMQVNRRYMSHVLSENYRWGLLDTTDFPWSNYPDNLRREYLKLFDLLRPQFSEINRVLAQKFAELYPESPDMQAYDEWASEQFDAMYRTCQPSSGPQPQPQPQFQPQQMQARSPQGSPDAGAQQQPLPQAYTPPHSNATYESVPGKVMLDYSGEPTFHPVGSVTVNLATNK